MRSFEKAYYVYFTVFNGEVALLVGAEQAQPA